MMVRVCINTWNIGIMYVLCIRVDNNIFLTLNKGKKMF